MKKEMKFSLILSLLYLGLGFLWIFFSDEMVYLLSFDPEWMTRAQNYKGSFFVFFTSYLLFLVLYKKLKNLEEFRENLISSEKRYRKLFNNMKNGVFMIRVSKDKKYFTVFDFNEKFFGIENKDIYEISFKDINEIFSEKKEIAEEIKKSYFTNMKRIYLDKRRGNGNVIYFIEYEIHKISTNEIIVIVRDRTEEEKIRQAIEYSKESYELLFQSNPDGIIFCDMKGGIVNCNSAALEIFNYRKDEILGKNIRILFSDEESMKIPESVDETMITNGKYIKKTGKKRGGRLFNTEYYAQIVEIANKKSLLIHIRENGLN